MTLRSNGSAAVQECTRHDRHARQREDRHAGRPKWRPARTRARRTFQEESALRRLANDVPGVLRIIETRIHAGGATGPPAWR